MEHPEFMNNLEKWLKNESSNTASLMFQLQPNLKHVKKQIKKWNKEVFGISSLKRKGSRRTWRTCNPTSSSMEEQ
jgi:hypothetical protein